MQRIVTASLNSVIPKNAPSEIVFIPIGLSDITPWVDGKAQRIKVNVPPDKGHAIAASLQASLAKRLESSVRPRLAFDHAKGGPAAGHPSSFSFDPERGIILAMSWSNSGKSAIEGGDYGYFSPTFMIDENGFPSGLPERGEIGSLVDEPAFRNIGLIAAADSDLNPETNNTISKLIFAALAISAAAENAESEAVDAIKALKVSAADANNKLATVEAANAELTKTVEAANVIIAKASKDRADTIVAAAVADGRIPARNTELQDKYRARIEAGDTFAEEMLGLLSRANGNLGTPIVNAGAARITDTGGFEGRAQSMVSAGSAKSLDEALGMVAATDPAAYSEYLGTLD